jgi:hypothetical protein
MLRHSLREGGLSLATLLRLTERYCVVYQTLANAPEIPITHTCITCPPSRKGGKS